MKLTVRTRTLRRAKLERDAAFQLLREVLASEDRITAAIGTTAEPEYVAKIRALVQSEQVAA